MAATLTNLITWEAFEEMPADGMHREILEGDVIALPPPKSRQTLIARRIAEILRTIEQNHCGSILIEAGYKLSHHPPTWIQQDISVLTTDRVQKPGPDEYFQGGPELAIEVVSPSETARDLNRKIDLLLAAGTLAVWVIYPDEEEVRVFLPDGTSFARDIHAVLTVPELFGALEIPVASLFTGFRGEDRAMDSMS
jgi:Uma2 family endonuclease